MYFTKTDNDKQESFTSQSEILQLCEQLGYDTHEIKWLLRKILKLLGIWLKQ